MTIEPTSGTVGNFVATTEVDIFGETIGVGGNEETTIGTGNVLISPWETVANATGAGNKKRISRQRKEAIKSVDGLIDTMLEDLSKNNGFDLEGPSITTYANAPKLSVPSLANANSTNLLSLVTVALYTHAEKAKDITALIKLSEVKLSNRSFYERLLGAMMEKQEEELQKVIDNLSEVSGLISFVIAVIKLGVSVAAFVAAVVGAVGTVKGAYAAKAEAKMDAAKTQQTADAGNKTEISASKLTGEQGNAAKTDASTATKTETSTTEKNVAVAKKTDASNTEKGTTDETNRTTGSGANQDKAGNDKGDLASKGPPKTAAEKARHQSTKFSQQMQDAAFKTGQWGLAADGAGSIAKGIVNSGAVPTQIGKAVVEVNRKFRQADEEDLRSIATNMGQEHKERQDYFVDILEKIDKIEENKQKTSAEIFRNTFA